MAREADPSTQIRELEARLAKGELPRAVLLRGAEFYFRDRAAALVVEAAKRSGAEICRHDADSNEFDAQALLGDLCSSGLFAATRLVVIESPEKVAKKDTTILRGVTTFLENKETPGTLLLVSESLRADSVLAKSVANAGGIAIQCRKLWESPPPWDSSQDPRKIELVQWLVSRAAERGQKLDANSALVLIAASGNDLFALEQQLERLKNGGGRKLFELVESDAAGSPFRLADDLAKGDLAGALFGIETLYHNGIREDDGTRKVDREALFAMLASPLKRSLRQAVIGASAIERGASPTDAELAAGVGGMEAAKRSFRAIVAARPAADQRAMLVDLARLERGQRRGDKVDPNVLTLFALRWRARRATAAR